MIFVIFVFFAFNASLLYAGYFTGIACVSLVFLASILNLLNTWKIFLEQNRNYQFVMNVPHPKPTTRVIIINHSWANWVSIGFLINNLTNGFTSQPHHTDHGQAAQRNRNSGEARWVPEKLNSGGYGGEFPPNTKLSRGYNYFRKIDRISQWIRGPRTDGVQPLKVWQRKLWTSL